MSQYIYSPLPTGSSSIRLLRLMPHKDDTANIQCEIFEYSLQNARGTHLYEALSYVWGSPDKKLPIFIHKDSIEVTVNLYAALLRLRNHSMERILWIDAISINQDNQEEKEHQIQLMARIYSQANRVVVWLGDSADDSDLALEEIRVAGDKHFTDSKNETLQQAVLALLQRPWFQRIWVIQEVAAARNILIRCGATSIDGYAFYLGVDLLKESYAACADLQNSIHPVAYLIRGAIFRPDHGRGSQHICSLGELMDMYHAHKATERHDKVYALLGMSSDDLSEGDLLPNYRIPWEELLQRLVKFLLCKKISVETWGNQEIAVIQSKGFVLGKVSSVQSRNRDNKQVVDVTFFRNLSGQPVDIAEKNAHWTLQVSAKSIQDGDLICLLQGVSKPIIVRSCKDYFAIVMIAAIPENIRSGDRNAKWLKPFLLEEFFDRDFLLVWDWGNSLEKLQDQAEYETLVQTNNWVLKHSKTEQESSLDKATRAWNLVLILGDSEEYKKAEDSLQDVVKGYEIAFGLKGSCRLRIEYGQTPLSWAAGNGYNTVVNLLLTKAGIDPDLKDKGGRTPLSWAASNGHEAVVKLLLETSQVDVDAKDKNGQTPLSWAASSGRKVAVVKLLLETGQVDVNAKDTKYGWTPLLWAASSGHEAVVKLLLEMGQVDVEAKDKDGRTALLWAASSGHEAVVKLLLETGQVDVNAKNKKGQTTLSWAASSGHEAVVKLLLETGQVDVNAKDTNYGWTPLLLAASSRHGHEAVVKLLLETGQVDVDAKDKNERTALLWAASRGHEAIVKLLLETGQVDVDAKDKNRQTPLLWAASSGHEVVVKLLLETGQVNVDAKNKNGLTPLLWAASSGHKAVVKLLLETGQVDVDAKDKNERTALLWAASNRHEAIVKLLLETSQVDVNAKDTKYGWTPLLLAASSGHEAVVKLLLETSQVDVNAKDTKYGWTPLLWAASSGHEAVVKLLLETGQVNVEAKDRDGRTPLSCAALQGHEAVFKLLQSHV